jgi:hypothetical protein
VAKQHINGCVGCMSSWTGLGTRSSGWWTSSNGLQTRPVVDTRVRTGPEPNTIVPATISRRSVSGLNRIGSVEAGAKTRAGTGPKPNAVVPSTVSRWYVYVLGRGPNRTTGWGTCRNRCYDRPKLSGFTFFAWCFLLPSSVSIAWSLWVAPLGRT